MTTYNSHRRQDRLPLLAASRRRPDCEHLAVHSNNVAARWSWTPYVPRSRQDPVHLLPISRLLAKITHNTHTHTQKFKSGPSGIVDRYTDLGSMGGTSTLAKSFCLLAARALLDWQRLCFRREDGVEDVGTWLLTCHDTFKIMNSTAQN